jgi:hypothetical protein
MQVKASINNSKNIIISFISNKLVFRALLRLFLVSTTSKSNISTITKYLREIEYSIEIAKNIYIVTKIQ